MESEPVSIIYVINAGLYIISFAHGFDQMMVYSQSTWTVFGQLELFMV